MTAKMRHADRAAIDDAVAALQPFYVSGDDGYPISLALDALAGVLGTKADVEVAIENALSVILEKLGALADVQAKVEKLYKTAAGGEYGSGLSKKQAQTINDLVQEVVDPLVEFITAYRRSRPNRPSARKNPVAKRRKR
jgi:hypothetical protein